MIRLCSAKKFKKFGSIISFNRKFSSALDAPTNPIANAASQVSELQVFGLGNTWTPVSLLQNVMDSFHTYTGLPWWASITLTSLALRLVLFPASIVTAKGSYNSTIYKEDIEKMTAKAKTLEMSGRKEESRAATMELMKFMSEKGCHPLRLVVYALLPAPALISMFLAVRGITDVHLPSLLQGGALWFTDLSVKDPYFILPCVSSSIILLSMEYHFKNSPGVSNLMVNVGRLFALIALPVMINLPSVRSFNFKGVIVYFISANLISFFQSFLWKNTKFRSLFKIGPVPKPNPAAPKVSFFEQFDKFIKMRQGDPEAEARLASAASSAATAATMKALKNEFKPFVPKKEPRAMKRVYKSQARG